MQLSEQALIELIEGGETTNLELKIAPPRPSELAERLCGMANGSGGIVVIGVEDGSLKIVGVNDARKTIDTVLMATRLVQPVLTLNPPEPEILVTGTGAKLVVASVPPNNGAIYQAGGVCWIRRGTHTIPLSVTEILNFGHSHGLTSWELLPVEDSSIEADIDFEKLKAYLDERSSHLRQPTRLEDIGETLIGMRCAKIIEPSKQIRLTNAGLLFFGKNPQHYVFQSEVVCVLFKDEVGMGGYLDRKIIRGTIQELIDGVELFLNKYIQVEGKIEGWKRVDYPEYPVRALREAVVNAVIHRDYSREGESIRIFFYSDRIEIHSPGLLLPEITPEKMARGEVKSSLRNPVLANLLRDLPGYMERIGSGIRFMLAEANRLNAQPPQFREIDEFVVTFYSARKTIKETVAPIQPENIASEPKQEVVPLTANLSETSFQYDRFKVAIKFVQENGYITSSKYQELADISERTALRDLELLVEQGALVRIGKTRARRYKLP